MEITILRSHSNHLLLIEKEEEAPLHLDHDPILDDNLGADGGGARPGKWSIKSENGGLEGAVAVEEGEV